MSEAAVGRDNTAPGIAPPGYRLPAATHVGRVRLQVGDLERSLEWYSRTLGMHAVERTAGGAALGDAEGTLTLVELVERRAAAAVTRRGQLGLYHYAILLPDRASLGRFVSHLGREGTPVGASDHLVSEALYLRDPDGLGIEVYADRDRSSWRRSESGELKMATEPLDLQAVARAGGGGRWAGMPAGTVIGHVHLHVGDLPRAEAFYHRALGFDRMVWSYPGALFLSAGGYHHHLGVNTWAAGASPPSEDDAQLLEWEVVVPYAADVSAARESFAASGFAVEEPSATEFAVRDPWGTRLRVSSAGKDE